jgi:3-phosphoglycerate kinase
MLSKKISLDNITKHLKNARCLMRVDFNVPIKEGKIKD